MIDQKLSRLADDGIKALRETSVKVLDCETVDSTYESLEQILHVNRSRLEHVFETFDIETFYRDRPHDQPPEDLVFSEVRKLTDLSISYDQTCWFHMTRTTPKSPFTNGILPLGESLDLIWELLGSLVPPRISRESWRAFRTDMGSSHFARLYNMKVASQTHWGPYAILIRDHAFSLQQTGSHDYFSAPEIVEDICMCFSERYDFDLLQAFTVNTKACLVKFVAHSPQNDCIVAAVYHLYNRLRGFDCSLDCNTCYDGDYAPAIVAGW